MARLAEELRNLRRGREVARLAEDGALRIVPRAGVGQHLLWGEKSWKVTAVPATFQG